MKIICISDTHLQHDFIVPEGDVLVHAGDMTMRGTLLEIARCAAWLEKMPHKYKICIAGNHDWLFQRESALAERIMAEAGVTYLRDQALKIKDQIFWGSPWQPEFCNWAFNLSRFDGSLAEAWDRIPDFTTILITHGPPINILDKNTDLESVGCFDLRQRIMKLPKLKAHIFGHIHCSYGERVEAGIKFINASVCDEKYRPTNPPIILEV